MRVITFSGVTPIPRFDGHPWAQVAIDESMASIGPWIQLEIQGLSPLDADPEDPQSRDITTELATLANGWYRLRFIDQTGDEESATQPIQNLETGPALYTPTVGQVGALLRARTLDSSGNELGTFTKETRPTHQEVDRLARAAANKLSTYAGDVIPEDLLGEATDLAALRTAMMIELGYFPEQVVAGRSPYAQWKELWDEAVGTPTAPGSFVVAVQNAVEDETVDVGGGSGEPHFAFPENKGGLIGWETKM